VVGAAVVVGAALVVVVVGRVVVVDAAVVVVGATVEDATTVEVVVAALSSPEHAATVKASRATDAPKRSRVVDIDGVSQARRPCSLAGFWARSVPTPILGDLRRRCCDDRRPERRR
jgi:hypothetical protein